MIGFLLFLCWLLLITIAFLAFDRLVYWEYANYKGNWKEDGQPIGFFWVPPEFPRPDLWGLLKGSPLLDYQDSDFLKAHGSSLSRRRLMFNWLFSTPAWVRGDLNACLRLYAWRGLVLLAVCYPLSPVLIDVFRR